MAKLIFIGLWLSGVAFASFYIGMKRHYEANNPVIKLHAEENKLKYERSQVINVPIITHDNVLLGYIVAQFIYIIDPAIEKEIDNTTFLDYLNDALLAEVYGKYTSEKNIDQIDLNDLKAALITKVNSNFKVPYLKGLVISHFNYYSLDVVKKTLPFN